MLCQHCQTKIAGGTMPNSEELRKRIETQQMLAAEALKEQERKQGYANGTYPGHQPGGYEPIHFAGVPRYAG